MSVGSTIRTVALATTAAAALFALSSTEVAAQQTAQTIPSQRVNVVPGIAAPEARAPLFADAAALEAYKAKMRRVLAEVRNLPAQELPEACNARIIGFSDALVKYNRDERFQPVLVGLSEQTLMNYARFVNCTDKDDTKVRTVNSVQEDGWRALMVANGIIPNTPPIYGPAYQANRRTSSLTDRSGPALAQNTK